MKMTRNARTFDRLKKIILKGRYDKEFLLLDIEDFLEMGTLTQEEADELRQLMEEGTGVPTKGQERDLALDKEGELVSKNTYLLLKKQINKVVYDSETIEQMLTDFRITGVLTRDEFKELSALVEQLYFPTYEEDDSLPQEVEESAKQATTYPARRQMRSSRF